MVTKRYYLHNLGCANCAAKMEANINTLPQVASATLAFATRQLTVTAEDPDALLPKMQAMVSAIESEATISPHPQQEDGHSHGLDHHEHTDHSHRELPVLLSGAGLFLVGVVLEALEVSLLGIPASAPVLMAAYLLLGLPVLSKAARNLTKGRVFDENFLMSIATLGAFVIGEFPEAVGIMLFYRIGEYFEHRAVERSRSQIMAAVDLRPETVTRVTFSGTEVIPAGHAQPGDLLLVRPGDRIPLDGSVFSGISRIDTAPITGEPVPVSVRPGDSLVSGCVNLSGQLTLEVEKPLGESMVTKILNAVENAAAGKPKIDRFITRFSRVYTPAVVIGAVLVAVLPPLFDGNWNYWVYTALSFLVMSCPCALVLSVPLAFFSGIGLGSKQGILFKGGLSMEAMADVQVVALDKTGTVTKGDFRVQDPDPELLALCASCEQHSSHPMAVSIVSAAKERRIRLQTPEDLEEIPGHGIRCTLQGDQLLCGNSRLMEDFGVEIPKTLPETAGSLVLVAKNGVYLGYLLICDTVKDGAAQAVDRLHRLGVTTAMLTGDREESARTVANAVGIRQVFARLLPQQKLEVLQTLRREHGKAMFVGDGINDAPVLAGADVGAAMGSGADAAIEAADVVYMTSDPAAIPSSIQIARQTRRIAWQNVIFALAVKALVMVLGLLGFASMWMAVFADSGVAMLCVLNAIRRRVAADNSL